MPKLTNVGSISNAPIVKVYDEKGRECTKEAEIEVDFGKLTILPREITLQTGSATAFNKDILYCQEYTVKGLADGDEISLYGLVFATQIGPGVRSNTITYDSLMVKNARGEDVTENYIIKMSYGLLILY